MMATNPLINGWICLGQSQTYNFICYGTILSSSCCCCCCCWCCCCSIGFMFMFHKTCNIIRHYWDNPFINWALLALVSYFLHWKYMLCITTIKQTWIDIFHIAFCILIELRLSILFYWIVTIKYLENFLKNPSRCVNFFLITYIVSVLCLP